MDTRGSRRHRHKAKHVLVASHRLPCLLIGVWRRQDVEIKRYGVRKQSQPVC